MAGKARLLHPFLLFVSVLVSFVPPCHQAEAKTAKTTQGKVMQVKDGDTVVVSPAEGGQFYICRLYGIDSPESYGKQTQAYGEEAKKELKELVLGQKVEVTTTGDKTHNREVCVIRKDGTDINREMVRRGYAWAFTKYLKEPYRTSYTKAEEEARAIRIGLWRDNDPMPPWEFRKKVRGN